MRERIFSFTYRTSRYLITNLIYFYQRLFLYSKDLEPAVKIGDKVLSSLMIFKKIIYDFPTPNVEYIKIYDLKFPSPLVGSSFKSEENILDIWLKMGLGGIIFKTIMKDKREGNPRPRLLDIYINGENGLFNSLGLPGPGIVNFMENIHRSRLWSYGRPIGISIGGETIRDYVSLAKIIHSHLDNFDQQYFYELNISCPNTSNGKTMSEEPVSLNKLLGELRTFLQKTISIKISPDIADKTLYNIGEICHNHENIIINAGNTHFRSVSELGISKLNFPMNGGGLSGPTIFNRTLELVKIFSNFDIPIMATGGISSINHVKELSQSGAVLFGMATFLNMIHHL